MGKFEEVKENFKGIKIYLGEIFTGIIVVALVIYSFVGIGLVDRFNNDFWIVFVVNFSIMSLITSVWFPSAKEKAKANDIGYKTQHRKYGEFVDKIVDTNNQKNLKKFCEYATEQNKICKIKRRLLKLNIDYNTYKKYEKCPSKIEEEKELTTKQIKGLRDLIIKGVYVKQISYSRVITGIKGSKLAYDTNSTETKYDVVKITTKILISTISSIFLGFIVFTLNGFTWESVAQFFTWLGLIVWNILTSYRAGYKAISINRTDYYKKLKTFLEEFVSSEFFNMEDVNTKDENILSDIEVIEDINMLGVLNESEQEQSS